MKKPESLRQWLIDSVLEIQKHPEKLQLFIDRGNLNAQLPSYDHNLSFEYQYTLNLIVTDFSVHTDQLLVPLLAWVKLNQTDIEPDAIQFEADIIDHKRIDLSITLPLTERVIVTQGEDGNYTTDHPGEPIPEYNLSTPDQFLELYGNGELLTQADE